MHYGVVGREWIKHLINLHHNNAIEPLYRAILENRLNTLPNDCHSQVKRVMSRFAILETTLKLSLDFTKWDVAECENAITKAFNEWVNIFGYHSREELQIIEQVNGWLLRNSSRFIEYPFNPNQAEPKDTAGYKELAEQGKNEKERYWIIPQVYLNDVISGFNEKQASEILANADMLERGREKGYPFRLKLPSKIKPTRTRCYLLYPLDESQDER